MAGKKAPLHCLLSLWLPLTVASPCWLSDLSSCAFPSASISLTPLAIWEGWGLLLGFSISAFPPFPQSLLNSPLNLSLLPDIVSLSSGAGFLGWVEEVCRPQRPSPSTWN